MAGRSASSSPSGSVAPAGAAWRKARKATLWCCRSPPGPSPRAPDLDGRDLGEGGRQRELEVRAAPRTGRSPGAGCPRCTPGPAGPVASVPFVGIQLARVHPAVLVGVLGAVAHPVAVACPRWSGRWWCWGPRPARKSVQAVGFRFVVAPSSTPSVMPSPSVSRLRGSVSPASTVPLAFWSSPLKLTGAGAVDAGRRSRCRGCSGPSRPGPRRPFVFLSSTRVGEAVRVRVRGGDHGVRVVGDVRARVHGAAAAGSVAAAAGRRASPGPSRAARRERVVACSWLCLSSREGLARPEEDPPARETRREHTPRERRPQCRRLRVSLELRIYVPRAVWVRLSGASRARGARRPCRGPGAPAASVSISSGCHCTPTREGVRGASMASTTPSGASALTTTLLARRASPPGGAWSSP